MIEIKKILKRDIPNLLEQVEFWNHSFLSISKHRLYSHYKNPNSDPDDIVLILAYMNQEPVGYMGLLMDKIILDNQEKKIGWLSTWWVHPKTKGTGVGREILNTMYTVNNGMIGISQFTPSAKRVYDKSGYFNDLKTNLGIKAVLRSNLSFVMPALFPKVKGVDFIYKSIDSFLNIFVNAKLSIQKQSIMQRLHDVRVEYLNNIDTETQSIINQFNTQDLSHKSPEFFEWLKAYSWVQKAPLLEFTEKDKFEFSMYDREFDIDFIKVKKLGECIGFIVLQKRNYVSKILFTYFDNSKYTGIMSDIIKLQNINQNTREIICYDEAICANLKKSSVFLYTTKKTKQSIISKAFNKTDFTDKRMNFGDGDCSFA